MYLMTQTRERALIHIVYSSAAGVEFGQGELLDLLNVSRANNARVGVTGILLFYKGSFFQVLEGHEPEVRQTYEKVSKDPRHSKMLKIIEGPVEKRAFQDWTMGFANMKIKDLKSIAGLNDFFNRGSCFYDLEQGSARKLLEAFKDGRWRQFISATGA